MRIFYVFALTDDVTFLLIIGAVSYNRTSYLSEDTIRVLYLKCFINNSLGFINYIELLFIAKAVWYWVLTRFSADWVK